MLVHWGFRASGLRPDQKATEPDIELGWRDEVATLHRASSRLHSKLQEFQKTATEQHPVLCQKAYPRLLETGEVVAQVASQHRHGFAVVNQDTEVHCPQTPIITGESLLRSAAKHITDRLLG